MQVSIVIPCYGRAELAVNAVRSALNQEFDPAEFEVIVVDSSLDDSVMQALQPLAETARCRFEIFRKIPEGPGPSRNMGVAMSRGDVIAFLDSDCQATPGWASALRGAFRKGIGIVQGRTIPVPHQKQSIFSHTIRIEQESFLYECANIAYSRTALEQAGGFLPDLCPQRSTPLGGEDTDLAWRVRRQGFGSVFAPDALVYHAILPMRRRDWVWIARLSVFPGLVRRYPELRQFFYYGYFYDRAQAYFLLLLIGLLGLSWHFAAFLLTAPYLIYRASEPTRSLRGPLRLVRPAVYFLRDFCSFCTLLRSSLRERTILI
jgi:glycosyltransferase involved in cell wall biosynthesis